MVCILWGSSVMFLRYQFTKIPQYIISLSAIVVYCLVTISIWMFYRKLDRNSRTCTGPIHNTSFSIPEQYLWSSGFTRTWQAQGPWCLILPLASIICLLFAPLSLLIVFLYLYIEWYPLVISSVLFRYLSLDHKFASVTTNIQNNYSIDPPSSIQFSWQSVCAL